MNLTHTHEFLITHITDSGTGFGVLTLIELAEGFKS